MQYIAPLTKLIEHFRSLPGIGAKTASRLAYHILDMEDAKAKALAKAIVDAKEKISYCSICFNLTDSDPCYVCESKQRDKSVICVVEQPRDVAAMERMRDFKGLYHVLHGVLSPMEGTGPEDINIAPLIQRLHDDQVKEVIIATNATTEGEATAIYLSRLIKPAGIKVTRLAHGLSVGSDIEYADEVTLLKAVEGRREL